MYTNMTLQDYFPYDSVPLGLQNRYSVIGRDSFLVNSPCVIATDKILTKTKHYLIFDIPTKSNIKMTEIVLVDLFFYESSIHLIAEDINTHRVSIVSFCLECPENDCTWILIDIDYFIKKMDARIIQNYCGCDNGKKKPIGKSKTKFIDDLLEFDF
jgi:hypothetical protein